MMENIYREMSMNKATNEIFKKLPTVGVKPLQSKQVLYQLSYAGIQPTHLNERAPTYFFGINLTVSNVLQGVC